MAARRLSVRRVGARIPPAAYLGKKPSAMNGGWFWAMAIVIGVGTGNQTSSLSSSPPPPSLSWPPLPSPSWPRPWPLPSSLGLVTVPWPLPSLPPLPSPSWPLPWPPLLRSDMVFFYSTSGKSQRSPLASSRLLPSEQSSPLPEEVALPPLPSPAEPALALLPLPSTLPL